MECYIKAERLSRERADEYAWAAGMYNMAAFGVVLSKAFSKNSKAEYPKETILQKVKAEKAEDNMTEEEIELARKEFVASLMTMQANFEMNHGGGD